MNFRLLISSIAQFQIDAPMAMIEPQINHSAWIFTMSNNVESAGASRSGYVVLDGTRISNALFAEIMDSDPDDMPMTFLSAIAELGMESARHLIECLGKEDKAWLRVLSPRAEK